MKNTIITIMKVTTAMTAVIAFSACSSGPGDKIERKPQIEKQLEKAFEVSIEGKWETSCRKLSAAQNAAILTQKTEMEFKSGRLIIRELSFDDGKCSGNVREDRVDSHAYQIREQNRANGSGSYLIVLGEHDYSNYQDSSRSPYENFVEKGAWYGTLNDGELILSAKGSDISILGLSGNPVVWTRVSVDQAPKGPLPPRRMP